MLLFSRLHTHISEENSNENQANRKKNETKATSVNATNRIDSTHSERTKTQSVSESVHSFHVVECTMSFPSSFRFDGKKNGTDPHKHIHHVMVRKRKTRQHRVSCYRNVGE